MKNKTALPAIEHLWIEQPLSVRRAAADLYAGVDLETLGLRVRAYNLVSRGQRFADVRALMLAGPQIWYLRGMGLATMREIDASLAPRFAGTSSPAVTGVTRAHDLPKQWPEVTADLAARLELASTSREPLEPALTALLRQHLLRSLNERDWDILRHRTGIAEARRMTLAELGEGFGLTRERVRQREAKILNTLRTRWDDIDNLVRPLRLHPVLQGAITDLRAFFARVRGSAMMEGELARQGNRILRRQGGDLSPLVGLLAEVEGLHRLDLAPGELDALWTAKPPSEIDRLRSGLLGLHSYLTRGSAAAHSAVELAHVCNRADLLDSPATVKDIHEWAAGCSSIEALPDGRYRGRLAYLGRRPMQALRLLADAGQPQNVGDLTRVLNHHLVRAGKPPVQPANLRNQMSRSGDLVPIGRSGHWALGTWPDLELDAVVKLMERCLVKHGRLMTAGDIFAWVSERRPVSLASIEHYLADDDRFRPVGGERWGLGHWTEERETPRWDRQGVADFVAGLFREQGAGTLPFDAVRAALAEAANLPERVADGLLAVNPVITTQREASAALIAVLQDDFQEQIDQARPHRQQRGHRVAEVLAEGARILCRQPYRQMPLVAFRDALIQALNIPSSTVYTYVARLPQFETHPDPAGDKKIVRLVDPS